MKLTNCFPNAASGGVTRRGVFMMPIFALAIILPLAAQTYFAWINPQTSSAPAARLCVGMAYDYLTRSTLLFGGGNGNATPYLTFGDTWSWQGGAWKQLSPALSPSPRQGPGMAFDGATGTIVLFGGVDTGGTNLSDTWTWDGVTWTRQFPPVSPPGPQSDIQSMTYDPNTRTVVLFGGLLSNADVLGDTWAWNGVTKTWTEQFPTVSPSARRTDIAYDAATKNVVLFGGDIRNGNNGLGIYLNDTWTWNGANWQQQFPTHSPSPRGAAAMTYDASIRQVVLFGGSELYASGLGLNDTWTWNGANWIERTPVIRPPATWAAGMAFDEAAKGVMLFGGEGNNNVFSNSTWFLFLE